MSAGVTICRIVKLAKQIVEKLLGLEWNPVESIFNVEAVSAARFHSTTIDGDERPTRFARPAPIASSG